jgi:hypothetical protein
LPLSKKPKPDEMRKTTLRRLEALEVANRAREEKEQSSLLSALVDVWMLVLAYYLGDLKSDEKDPFEAYTRALKYLSRKDYVQDLLYKMNILEIRERHNDAYHRLFAKIGLDLDTTPSKVLFDAFVTMVDQLPDRWLIWLRSKWQWRRELEIPAGANLPRQLSAENFLTWWRWEGAA